MLGLDLSLALAAGLSSPWQAAPLYLARDLADDTDRVAAFIADFRQDRHALATASVAAIPGAPTASLGDPVSASFADLFTFTRTSPAEYEDRDRTIQIAAANVTRFDYANGHRQLLLEGASTNLFLFSHAPATQTVGVVSGTQYTISCRGSGSLVLSGAATGTVTQASPLTVTASGTSLTVTVSGSLSRAQVEAAAFASSFIQTDGVAATRNPDSCRLSPKGEALAQRSGGTMLVQGRGVFGSNGRFIGFNAGDDLARLSSVQTFILAGSSLSISPVTTPLPAFGLCITWNGTGRAGSYNGSTVVSNAIVPVVPTQVFLARSSSATHVAWGRYDGLTIWPFRATPASIAARALPYG